MARVAVVGSVAVDHVVRLKEPLRAGTHVEGCEVERRLGGGGANVAVPLARAGHDVLLFSALGQDEDAAWLEGQLTAAGLGTGDVLHASGPSTRSLVLIDPTGERSIVNLTRCVDADLGERLAGVDADVLYVRTRVPGLASAMASACRRMRVVAHAPPCGAAECPAHILVGSALDLPAEWQASPFAAARIAAGSTLEWVVVTRGADGARALSEHRHIEIPAVPTKAVDTTGAGDAFAAGVVHCLARREPIDVALRVGAAWGAAAAGQEGSVLSSASVGQLLEAFA
jgi:sugar/nucleoside kinase (ribokinase family)